MSGVKSTSDQIWLITLSVMVLVLYVLTAAPGLLWGDSAEFQRRAYTGTLLGGSTGHPLWTMAVYPFVRWFPIGTPTWRTNISSGFCAALTVCCFGLCFYEMSKRKVASLAAMSVLAVSHTFWLHAVIAEVYALHLAILTMAAWLLVRGSNVASGRRMALSWILVGLSLSVHLMTLPLLPAFIYLAFLLEGRDAWKLVVWGIFGLAVHWLLDSVVPSQSVTSISGFVTLVLGQAFWRESLRYLLLAVGYWVYQFVASAMVGMLGMSNCVRKRSKFGLFWFLWVAGSAAFAFTHRVPDQYVFYLPTWVGFAAFCGYGFAALSDWFLARITRIWHRVALVLVILGAPSILYFLMPTLAHRVSIPLPIRYVAYRDSLQYFFFPPKPNETSARRYVDEVFSSLPSESLLIADWTPYAPLSYAQEIEGDRPDVELVHLAEIEVPIEEFLLSQDAQTPQFLAGVNRYYPMAELRRYFDIEPDGVLYRLERKR